LVDSGALMTIGALGTLEGNGTIVGNVSNSGVVAPGATVGALQINGGYTQAAAGTLRIGLAGLIPGIQFDRLLVSGAMSLDGTLQVTLSSGFTPSVGASFDILNWGILSGTFSSIQLPSLVAGLSWNTSQLYTSGVLFVTGPGFELPGDFDHNGVV